MVTPLAIVSGATGGIGQVVAQRLWAEGYSILALGKTPEKCLVLQDWFLAHSRPDQHEYVTCMDLTRANEYGLIERVLTASSQPFTLLVTCHGAVPVPGPALYAADAMRIVYETDVLGTFALCQLSGRYMLEQRTGCIVLVSSLHARQTYPARVPYATAKTAICGMARALAVEWGLFNIRVNSIVPWQVDGPRSQQFMSEAAAYGYDLLEAYKQRSPMRRLVQPEEIAETVLWLARTPSVNGADIVLDSGVSASMWHRGFTTQE